METAALAIFRVPLLNSIQIEEISIDELQQHLALGTFTSYELTIFCLERIRQVREQSVAFSFLFITRTSYFHEIPIAVS